MAIASGGNPVFVSLSVPKATHLTLDGTACVSSRSCFAVGSFQAGAHIVPAIERWNGKRWSTMSSPSVPGAELLSVACPSSRVCVAVGDRQNGTFAERFGGRTWRIAATPSPGSGGADTLYSVSCTSSSSCFAVGGVGLGSAAAAPLFEHWDGRGWSLMGTGGASGFLSAVSCGGVGSCAAVGIGHPFASKTTALAERFEGGSWHVVGTPAPPGRGTALQGVSCASATHCFAAGAEAGSDGLFLEFAGGRWRRVSGPPARVQITEVEAVACVGAVSCVATGALFPRDGTSISDQVPMVLVWDGSRVTPLKTGALPRGTRSGYLSSVDCLRIPFCMTVGTASSNTRIAALAEAGPFG